MSCEKKTVEDAISLMAAQPGSVVPSIGGFKIDATRFNHELIGLNEETIGLFADVLGDSSYDRPKEQLIRRLSVNEKTKLNHLLEQ